MCVCVCVIKKLSTCHEADAVSLENTSSKKGVKSFFNTDITQKVLANVVLNPDNGVILHN